MNNKNNQYKGWRHGGIGRHAGLKILWAVMPVPVRPRFRVQPNPASIEKQLLAGFFFLSKPQNWSLLVTIMPKVTTFNVSIIPINKTKRSRIVLKKVASKLFSRIGLLTIIAFYVMYLIIRNI